jgi:hypothetical protein
LLSHDEHIALVHISDTGLEAWGHDPIGTGVVDFDGLGSAVEATCGESNVVLEIIREEDPVQVFNQAMDDLRSKGWHVGKLTSIHETFLGGVLARSRESATLPTITSPSHQ